MADSSDNHQETMISPDAAIGAGRDEKWIFTVGGNI